MIHKFIRLFIILALLGVIAAAYYYFSQNPAQLTALQLRLGLISQAEADGVHSASGYIEAEEINIAAESGGRITEITVDEGDMVKAGQVLVKLDTKLLHADVQQTEAKITTARALLAKSKAGPRVAEISKAKAAVAVAEANVKAAQILRQDTITLRDNPQELDIQIDAARTAVKLAEQRINYVAPLKDAAVALSQLREQDWRDVMDGQDITIRNPRTGDTIDRHIHYPEGVEQDISMAWNLTTADEWAAWVNLSSAQADYNAAQTVLNDLLTRRNDPQEAQVKVAQAEATYQTALAQVEVAKAQLAVLQAGTRAEQIAIAEAQVKQAEASLAGLTVQQDQHTLAAPLAGWVVERTAHEGEMASPGRSLLTLADLTDLTLTIYVPTSDIDLIKLGQQIEIYVDTFPGQAFTGRVTFINDEAEFTPKNVQTKEERVNTVFAVKIKLDNPDQRLKPGMPADVILDKGAGL